ncbi:hypothetical protein B0H19DRAFT_1067660 [Mycena capillaripes]|nr:hypothetical protein B0H19DRAFT_1067660 [Mycena capillaripes]
MYVAQLEHTRLMTQEVYLDYKEYLNLNTEFNPSELEMSRDAEVEYEWKKLRMLGGAPVAQNELLDLTTELVTADDCQQDQLLDVEVEEDYDIVDDVVMSPAYFA